MYDVILWKVISFNLGRDMGTVSYEIRIETSASRFTVHVTQNDVCIYSKLN